jgi:hypothetical protein
MRHGTETYKKTAQTKEHIYVFNIFMPGYEF